LQGGAPAPFGFSPEKPAGVVSTQRMFSGFIFMTTYSGPAGICLQLVVFLSNFIAFSSF
jgi:hypothetical protein